MTVECVHVENALQFINRSQTCPQAPQMCMGIPLSFDVFRSHTVDLDYLLLKEYHSSIVSVPSNYMDRLQPLDISMNKPAKDHLRKKFLTSWYAKERGKSPDKVSVDMWLTISWLTSIYKYFQRKPDIRGGGGDGFKSHY